MTRVSLLVLMLVCLCRQNAGAQSIVVRHDGSIHARLRLGTAPEQPLVLRFGLPAAPPQRRWQENDALRTLWATNGIRYTQTVVVLEPGNEQAARDPNSTGRGDGSPDVLLVNIEGENSNAEYAEASADLIVELGGKRQALELKEELVWCGGGESRTLLGALEIPESGIKVARGEALKFYGNIPPSLKGSMTLKIPLKPLKRLAENGRPEWLIDIEFDAVLRRALRRQDEPAEMTNCVRVVFAEEGRAKDK